MQFDKLVVPPEFLVSKTNLFRNPTDVSFGLWPLHYQEIATWSSHFNKCIFYEDPFVAHKCFSVLFGLVQPALQAKKDKWKNPLTGLVEEQNRIEWYRNQISTINNQLIKINPYISRTLGQTGYSINKTEKRLEVIQTLQKTMKDLIILHWRLQYDMHSVGLTFPRGENPSKPLMKSQ